VAPAQTAGAQSVEKLKRIGYLSSGARASGFHESFQSGLRDLGWIVDQNVAIEYRFAEGKNERLPQLAAELVRLRVDLIVAQPTTAVLAAKNATSTIPIVMVNVGDPDRIGLVDSLAHPGGNVTGVVILIGELEAKRLSLLLETVPDRRRVAALVPAGSRANETALRKAAAGLGVELLVFPAGAPSDYPAAFAAMEAQGAQALVIGATPQFQRDGKQLADLALKARLPTVCEWAEMAHAGCLIGYGPSRTALRKRMADQLARIFRGVPPGDLPIEQPIVFEFAVNQKIAKLLDVSIPSAVLIRADDVIE